MDFKHAGRRGFICLLHAAGLSLWEGEGGREEREFGLSGGRGRVREVSLSHKFENDLFFPSKVTSCWPHLTPPFSSPIPSHPALLMLTVATVCCSVPCVHSMFVLCVCAGVLAKLILNPFCHCLFRWATVVQPLLRSGSDKWLSVCVHLLVEG